MWAIRLTFSPSNGVNEGQLSILQVPSFLVPIRVVVPEKWLHHPTPQAQLPSVLLTLCQQRTITGSAMNDDDDS